MINNEPNETGVTGGGVKAGWEKLPTATKMIIGGVLVIVALGLLRFLLG